jgi:pyruvate/oxaloacetate carboxyltransferase
MVTNLANRNTIGMSGIVSLYDVLALVKTGTDVIDTYFASFAYRTTHYY